MNTQQAFARGFIKQAKELLHSRTNKKQPKPRHNFAGAAGVLGGAGLHQLLKHLSVAQDDDFESFPVDVPHDRLLQIDHTFRDGYTGGGDGEDIVRGVNQEDPATNEHKSLRSILSTPYGGVENLDTQVDKSQSYAAKHPDAVNSAFSGVLPTYDRIREDKTHFVPFRGATQSIDTNASIAGLTTRLSSQDGGYLDRYPTAALFVADSHDGKGLSPARVSHTYNHELGHLIADKIVPDSPDVKNYFMSSPNESFAETSAIVRELRAAGHSVDTPEQAEKALKTIDLKNNSKNTQKLIEHILNTPKLLEALPALVHNATSNSAKHLA